jgi:hypothetical protein
VGYLRRVSLATSPTLSNESFTDVLLCALSIGVEASVLEDVRKLKAWEFLPTYTKVVGYVSEIETGFLRPVDEDTGNNVSEGVDGRVKT